MPYSWIAIVLLTAALLASGALLKGQIQTNGELKQAAREHRSSIAEKDSEIARLGKNLETQKAEQERLDKILAEREAKIREHSKQSAANKDAARVAVEQSPDLKRCSDVYWPDDVVQRLREQAGQGGGVREGKATGTSALGLRTPLHQKPPKYHY